MMISRPIAQAKPGPSKGHSESPLQPLEYLRTNGPRGGYPAPIIRTAAFTFAPGTLPPVNKIKGSPRPNG